MADIRRLTVRFDDEAFAEDVDHATAAGRRVAQEARIRLEREGLATTEARRCMAEGPDGTRLPHCVKVYLPPPDGQWGLVLEVVRSQRTLQLAYLAFGLRHPDQPWQPSVYQVAHRRLHAGET